MNVLQQIALVLLCTALLAGCSPLKAKTADDCECGRHWRQQNRPAKYVGQTLTVVGAVAALAGAAILIKGARDDNSDLDPIGGGVGGAGIAPLCVGIPLWVYGAHDVPRCKRCPEAAAARELRPPGPKPKPASRGCGCGSDDLMCNMRCAQRQ